MAVIEISAFTKRVLQNIAKIPKGKVATYKQIAMLSGKPQGSRGVAWILHSCSTTYKLPWHRVLNSQGRISFDKNSYNFRQQKRKLEAEGVVLTPEGQLDLIKFKWKKRPTAIKNPLSPKMFS
jgi:methylated-DNA-protein-cysteine methyltransferase related protein